MRNISITRALAVYIKNHDCQFLIQGEPEPAAFMFSPEAFLPILAMHADLASRSLLGHPLGITFEEDEQALFGVRSIVPALTGDEISVLRATFFTSALHQVFGLAKDVKEIECVPVFDAYKDGFLNYLEKGVVKWPVAIVSHR